MNQPHMSPWFTSWNICDFGFTFAELFEFEFDSPLHDAAGSQPKQIELREFTWMILIDIE